MICTRRLRCFCLCAWLVVGLIAPLLFAPQAYGQRKMYWTDQTWNEIHRANLDGSDVQLVAFGLSRVYGIAVDPIDGYLYWTDLGKNHIVRANLDGTGPQVVVTQPSKIWQLAIDSKHRKIYWTGSGNIGRANMDGSNPEIIFSGDGSPAGIAVDTVAGKVYWSDTGIFERIRRVNLDGSDVEDILYYPFYDFIRPDGFAIDVKSRKMYWADQLGDRGGSIHRANLDGSEIEAVVPYGIGSLWGMAIDEESAKIYWLDVIAGKIKRSNLDGSSMQTLVAQNLRWPCMIALDLRPHLAEAVTVSPSNGQKNVSTSPELHWSSLQGAKRYVVQVFRDAALSELVMSDTTEATSEVLTAPNAQANYFWRVRGLQSGESGPWSAVSSFTTGSAGPLAAQPLSPGPGAAWIPVDPIFEWEGAVDASAYRFQLSTDPAFESPAVDSVLSGQTSFGPAVLDYEQQYFWRVRGQMEDGSGTWSAVYSFTTRSETMQAPELLSPGDAAGGLSALPTLIWEALPGAVTYHVQIAMDEGFASVLGEDSTLANPSYVPIDPLSYSSTYYWRARGRDELGWGVWSAPRHFATGTGTESETLTEAADNDLLVFPNPITATANVVVETAAPGRVTVTVWDVAGRQLDCIFEGVLTAGTHTFHWSSWRLAGGVYLLRLDAANESRSKVVVLIR